MGKQGGEYGEGREAETAKTGIIRETGGKRMGEGMEDGMGMDDRGGNRKQGGERNGSVGRAKKWNMAMGGRGFVGERKKTKTKREKQRPLNYTLKIRT